MFLDPNERLNPLLGVSVGFGGSGALATEFADEYAGGDARGKEPTDRLVPLLGVSIAFGGSGALATEFADVDKTGNLSRTAVSSNFSK